MDARNARKVGRLRPDLSLSYPLGKNLSLRGELLPARGKPRTASVSPPSRELAGIKLRLQF